MAKKLINIKIDPFGGSTVEAEGFTGTSCKEATEALEQCLASGAGDITSEIKEEWYQSERTDGTTHVHEGEQSW